MSDLLTCTMIALRIVVLTVAILASLKFLLHTIRDHEIPPGECVACALTWSLFAGLMGWLN